ncbi:hypothetical protein [Mariniflexile maritimum]|uniref:hypothetical protein n=1 Tax=Mariniflexile maritimum TaxID=2682493 RepID=UPI0012F6A928|nr:hypothetical protein [Mariniflexile maritimum]MCB0450773.1 hypothetical protein [Confluentibacter sp.]HMQ45239.1 hypothetical protein [Mariniflexile sp.]HMR16541.1 hypothetical protein [Mariniflexile sp.]
MGIITYLNEKDSELFIFPNFIINQVKEGVLVESHHNDILNTIIHRYFRNREMVYISNRVNSYTVNPLIYNETEKIPNLIAIAMIPETDTMRKNAEYERTFFDKPYEIFETLGEAIFWAHQLVAEYRSQISSQPSV